MFYDMNADDIKKKIQNTYFMILKRAFRKALNARK